MSAQVESIDLPGNLHQRSRDPEGILQKLDLSRIDEWEPKLQQEAQGLICEYASIFSQNDLDLGKTSIVKHSIKVKDLTLFKECHQCIPPGLYDEVKAYIQEMLEVGAIRPSSSAWTSAVVLVWKNNMKL